MSQLLVANSSGGNVRPAPRRSSGAHFAKASPPKLGEKFGPQWAGTNKAVMQLPGGGLLMFDLDKLTLQDYRAMRNHYQVNISLSVLSFMVHQVPWRIEGGDKKVREFVEDNLREVWTRLVRALSVSYWSGYAPIILQYENDQSDGKIRLTKFKDVEPENAFVNWKEVDGYAPPGAAKPKIRVFDGMRLSSQQSPVPPENCLWYPLLMEAGDHYGRKLLKPAFPSWFFSQIIHLYVNRYFERFGEPVPVGRAPFEDELDMGDGNTMNGKAAMELVLDQMRNRASVVLPNTQMANSMGSGGRTEFEYQLEYIESQMRGADFERYLSRLDEEMSLGIFTPVLLYRTADVGSYNLGEAHERIFLIMTNSMIGDAVEYINRFIVKRLIDFNFGKNARKDVRFVPHKMGEQVQATLRQILQALIQNNMAMPDLEELGLSLGMTIHEIETIKSEDTEEAGESVVPSSSSGSESSDDDGGGQADGADGGQAGQASGQAGGSGGTTSTSGSTKKVTREGRVKKEG